MALSQILKSPGGLMNKSTSKLYEIAAQQLILDRQLHHPNPLQNLGRSASPSLMRMASPSRFYEGLESTLELLPSLVSVMGWKTTRLPLQQRVGPDFGLVVKI